MKITRIQAYTYDAAYAHGTYAMSHGRVSLSQPSLVVRIETDEGLTGWAETCPHGRTYLPSFFEGELAAVAVLAPTLIGQDPRNPGVINDVMDRELLGSNPAKAVLDTACWDLQGKALGVHISHLLGGRLSDSVPMFSAIPVGAPDTMAEYAESELAAGVRTLQIKVGDDPLVDARRVRAVVEAVGEQCTLLADANGGWSLASALIAAGQLADLPVRLEQPCRTLAEVAELSRHTALPIVVDECVVTVEDLLRARQLAGAAGLNLKPSRVGGLTRARILRDTAQGLGMTITVDDTWGSSLAAAQVAAVAASSHPDNVIGATFFTHFVEPRIADGIGETVDGRLAVPTAPGLGVVVDEGSLGDAILDVGGR